ncbi:hypothetical protein HD554DRAFT_2035522 [Boletus coccyginus]|nr:hypothetical protein HD554DRAFT_2035522 [Boletus coccyginus]
MNDTRAYRGYARKSLLPFWRWHLPTKTCRLPTLNITNLRLALGRDHRALPDGADVLRIVPFGEWFALLESKAESTSEDDLPQIPTTQLLEFFRALPWGDEAIWGPGVGTTEAAGMTNFSTSKSVRR